MSREIKLRALKLRPQENGMLQGFVYCNGDGVWFDGDRRFLHEIDTDTVSQYISVKDVKGREVFEEDIVTVTHNDKIVLTGIIGYNIDRYIIDGKTNCMSNNHFKDISVSVDKLTVIGNIYENPDIV